MSLRPYGNLSFPKVPRKISTTLNGPASGQRIKKLSTQSPNGSLVSVRRIGIAVS